MMQLLASAALLLHVAATPTQVLQSADTIRRLAAHGVDSALVARAKESPDDVREALRQLLAEAARDSTNDALPSARRLASVYATAWHDSFFVKRIARFEQMTPAQRIAKARGDSLRLAGNTALDRSGVDAAMRRWRDSHRIFERIADTAGVAAALGNLGVGFLRREDLDSAESYLTRSRELATRIGDHRTAGNAMSGLGEVSRVRGDLREARERFTRAEASRPLTGDTRGLAADRNNIGLIDQELGDLAAARKAFEGAFALNSAAGRDGLAATNLINLGNLLGLEANYGEALEHYGRALSIYRRDQSEPDVAFTLHSIGALAMRRGDYRGAIASLREAAAIYRRTGPPVAEIAARQDLFSARAAMGDLQGARAELQRGEVLAAAEPETESRETRARLALLRGDLELQFNRLRDAEREYSRAVELTRGTTDVATRSAAQQGIGMVLLIRENYARAQPALELALRAQEAAGERRSAALSRLLVAYAARHRGDTALARRAIRRALDTLDVLGDAVGQAAALGALGDLDLSNGLRLTAESLYHRGLARLGERSAPDIAWQLHAGVARASASRGDRAAAAAALQRAIREIERVSGTAISKTRIDLSWQDDATRETGWEIHRSTAGPAGTFTLLATTGANVTSYSDTGLTPLIEYCYRVRSFKTSGKKTSYGDFSNTSCSTTPGPPPAPSNADARPANSSAVDVSWADNSATEDGFRVERASAATGPWEPAATTSANVVSHRDPGRVSEQQVCYRMVAFNAHGASEPSNADCTTPPAGPLSLAATAVNKVVYLTWIDNSLVEDGYGVQRAEAEAGPYSTVAILAANSTSYSEGLSGNTTYWYRVTAKKDGGFSDFSNTDSATTNNCSDSPESVCDNGVDDDCDGFVDTADPDCADDGSNCAATEKFCADGADNDCDGLVDGADPDCPAPPCDYGCPPGMTCYPDGFCYYSPDSDAATDLYVGDFCQGSGDDA